MEKETDAQQYKVWGSLNAESKEEDVDQLQLLEEKVDHLIALIDRIKREKDAFKEREEIREEKLATMAQQVESLRTARDLARKKVVSLLEKIEQIEV